MGKCMICKVVTVLGGLGALNWLLVAHFNLNLVATILGDMTLGAKIVYTLIGLSGVVILMTVFKKCPCGESK